jgi:RNA polymerase sigma factor (sigma-70 family)
MADACEHTPIMEAVRTLEHGTVQLSDQEVVAQVLNGRKGLYEILLRRYNRTLYRAVRSYLHEEADVKDAMQETYLKAYQKLDQYRAEAAFATWLVRIGVNEALQRIRAMKRLRVHEAGDVTGDRMVQLPDPERMDPEQKAIYHQTGGMVEAAISQLGQDHRAVYMLREVEGMSTSEVAACLDISEANVKVRLHRAKTILKDALWQQLTDTPVFYFGHQRCDALVAAVMERI